jgi:hypothetical protein
MRRLIRILSWTASLAVGGLVANVATNVARGDGAFDANNPAAAGTYIAANLGSGDSAAGATAGDGAGDGKPVVPAVQHGPRIEGGQVNGHWREGTRLVEQLGQFKVAGDRLSFTSADGSLHFDCLENLCGQRVARTVTDSPEPLVWSVTGELTEYRGTNFLLLTQVVLKPRPRRTAAAP